MAVLVTNRQRSVVLHLPVVAALATQAGEVCGGQFDPVEVSIVSDRRIAALHRQFLQVRGATDVITFAHGEIVISAAAAVRGARENGEVLERELCRYIVHGLLHLGGYEDATPTAQAAMWRVQEDILSRLWPLEAKVKTNVRKRVSRR